MAALMAENVDMSKDEELSAIGRLVNAAAEARKREALLRSDLEAWVKNLQDASTALHGAIHGIPNPDLEAAIRDIPLAEKVLTMLAEYSEESSRSSMLRSRLFSFGV
jgi:hypothetical protein